MASFKRQGKIYLGFDFLINTDNELDIDQYNYIYIYI